MTIAATRRSAPSPSELPPGGGRRSRTPALPPFERLLDEHGTSVYRFLVASVGRGDAADCFQETILAALRTYPTLRSADHLRGWLFAIARSKAADVGRRRARTGPSPAGVAGDGVPGSGDAPAADQGVADGDLWAAVAALPPGQRDAVRARFAADLPFAEVGRLLGCSEAAARQRVREGVAKLREVVER